MNLASIEDIEALSGRKLDNDEKERAEVFLEKASAQFRRLSGQWFTPGESKNRLKVDGGRVFLSQRPVTEVLDVTDDEGRAVTYKWDSTVSTSWLSVPLVSHEFVIVHYKHGGVVPAEVRIACAEIANRVLNADPRAASGVSSMTESRGGFSGSTTFANWAQGGQIMLSPNDIAVAKQFRVKVPHVWVMQ